MSVGSLVEWMMMIMVLGVIFITFFNFDYGIKGQKLVKLGLKEKGVYLRSRARNLIASHITLVMVVQIFTRGRKRGTDVEKESQSYLLS